MKSYTLVFISIFTFVLLSSCEKEDTRFISEEIAHMEELILKTGEVKPGSSIPKDETLVDTIEGKWDQQWTMGFIGDQETSIYCGTPYSCFFDKNNSGSFISDLSDSPFRWLIRKGYLLIVTEQDTSLYAIQELSNTRLKIANAEYNNAHEVVITQFQRE